MAVKRKTEEGTSGSGDRDEKKTKVCGTSSSSSSGRFTGKTIVITGAGGNFGRAGAEFFASEGCNIVAVDAAAAPLEETRKLVDKAVGEEGRIITVLVDVTKEDEVQKIVTQAKESFGGIDLLWNNAGYQGAIKPLLEYPVADFQRVMDINVVGMFSVLKAVAAAMKEGGNGGVICNTASVAGLRGTPAMVAYASSKAAVICMTVSAAKDLAPFDIRVNSISPALIGPGFMWDRQNELHAQSGSPYFPSDPEAVAKSKVAGVPLKRLGSIQEVIKSVAYLLSDDSSYSTATNLVVDGGLAGGIKA